MQLAQLYVNASYFMLTGGPEPTEGGRGAGAGGGVQVGDQAGGRSQEDVITVQHQ